MTETKFFVYGSMSEGLVHFSRIREFVVSMQRAHLRAQAWRLPVGFPVLVQSEEDLVPGELVTLNMTDLLSCLLDSFHGFNPFDPENGLYFKREVVVQTEAGEERSWAYFLNPGHLPAAAKKIAGGDWKKDLQASPPITDKLTPQQKQYILKLSTVKGRETVPCDLNSVYRPLMNLELIVDKGRRSALSKLGYEVVKYLG